MGCVWYCRLAPLKLEAVHTAFSPPLQISVGKPGKKSLSAAAIPVISCGQVWCFFWKKAAIFFLILYPSKPLYLCTPPILDLVLYHIHCKALLVIVICRACPWLDYSHGSSGHALPPCVPISVHNSLYTLLPEHTSPCTLLSLVRPYSIRDLPVTVPAGPVSCFRQSFINPLQRS